jgi:hypothetical protein
MYLFRARTRNINRNVLPEDQTERPLSRIRSAFRLPRLMIVMHTIMDAPQRVERSVSCLR